jgi:hypothetical protein
MGMIVDRGANWREAPMVIGPRNLARLIRQIVGAVRREPSHD